LPTFFASFGAFRGHYGRSAPAIGDRDRGRANPFPAGHFLSGIGWKPGEADSRRQDNQGHYQKRRHEIRGY
jgi:hypothetical protein